MRTRLAMMLATTALVAGLAGAQNATQNGGGAILLNAGSFEDGLRGWTGTPDAEYALDPGTQHEGMSAARITVAPDAELHWQQLRRDFSQDVRPGDELRAQTWVYAPGLTVPPGSGAYLALEFVGAGGERVGIAHSRVDGENGRKQWELLTAEGVAPKGTVVARVSLILHAHGTAWFAGPALQRTGRLEEWPDLGDAIRKVTVNPAQVVQPDFVGVGFHAFQHTFDWSDQDMDEVILKRWRELSPSFVRMNDAYTWDHAMLDKVARHILAMKQVGTKVYIATWGPADTAPGEDRRAYARRVVDNLEYLIRQKGCDNIKWYCMTNELSLGGWGALSKDLPKFKDYHQCLYDEIKARGLDVGLLASDASPQSWWWTVEWAAQNMDNITAIYGGHHYINEHPLDDERFYPWFYEKTKWAADIARTKGKDFILGEFGCKQDGRTINGVKLDNCVYWDTPQEPLVTLQLADAVIAAVNAGVCAMGYWTFMDFPDEYSKTYTNKWGVFKCSGKDRSTRAPYYGYGLLTKFFRGPARVCAVQSSDPRLRVAAMQRPDGKWSVAVLNRNARVVSLDLKIEGETGRFRKYVYDPAHIPQNPFGDLQGPERTVEMAAGRLQDAVQPMTLTVYTTAYDDVAPAAVKGLQVAGKGGSVSLTWEANSEADLCYYRVYRSEMQPVAPTMANQIGSTIATHFTDSTGDPARHHWRVVAVDQSGNAGD
jgi:hypothetical protein